MPPGEPTIAGARCRQPQRAIGSDRNQLVKVAVRFCQPSRGGARPLSAPYPRTLLRPVEEDRPRRDVSLSTTGSAIPCCPRAPSGGARHLSQGLAIRDGCQPRSARRSPSATSASAMIASPTLQALGQVDDARCSSAACWSSGLRDRSQRDHGDRSRALPSTARPRSATGAPDTAHPVIAQSRTREKLTTEQTT